MEWYDAVDQPVEHLFIKLEGVGLSPTRDRILSYGCVRVGMCSRCGVILSRFRLRGQLQYRTGLENCISVIHNSNRSRVSLLWERSRMDDSKASWLVAARWSLNLLEYVLTAFTLCLWRRCETPKAKCRVATVWYACPHHNLSIIYLKLVRIVFPVSKGSIDTSVCPTSFIWEIKSWGRCNRKLLCYIWVIFLWFYGMVKAEFNSEAAKLGCDKLIW